MYRKRKSNTENYVQQKREYKSNGMESLEVTPQARDQAKKVPTNNANSWSPLCS